MVVLVAFGTGGATPVLTLNNDSSPDESFPHINKRCPPWFPIYLSCGGPDEKPNPQSERSLPVPPPRRQCPRWWPKFMPCGAADVGPDSIGNRSSTERETAIA